LISQSQVLASAFLLGATKCYRFPAIFSQLLSGCSKIAKVSPTAAFNLGKINNHQFSGVRPSENLDAGAAA
jgi:hypothetical protein